MLRVCLDCTTRYAVGAERCPHCGVLDASNVDEGAVEQAAAAVEADEGATRTQRIRAWARANGHDVADAGPVPLAVQAAYDDAHEDADKETAS